jgi:ABC-type polysaccharide/polyol phosphate transport system ATPase subunit
MHGKIAGIEAFAGIGAFFDAPLRAYSAGMMVRLAFATATSIDADILLIDEALAVGDAAFQRASRDRMDAFRRGGVTSVIASHDVRHLADICDRMLWLDRGQVAAIGASHEVVEQYLEHAGAAQ